MNFKDKVKYAIKRLNYTNIALAKDLGMSKQALDIKINKTHLWHKYELILVRNFLRQVPDFKNITIDEMLEDEQLTEEIMFQTLLSSHKSKMARYIKQTGGDIDVREI